MNRNAFLQQYGKKLFAFQRCDNYKFSFYYENDDVWLYLGQQWEAPSRLIFHRDMTLNKLIEAFGDKGAHALVSGMPIDLDSGGILTAAQGVDQ